MSLPKSIKVQRFGLAEMLRNVEMAVNETGSRECIADTKV